MYGGARTWKREERDGRYPPPLISLCFMIFFSFSTPCLFVSRPRLVTLTRRGGWFGCDLDVGRGGSRVRVLKIDFHWLHRLCPAAAAAARRKAGKRSGGSEESGREGWRVGVGGRGGEGAGWGAVCVSSALKRNKGTHGGSSQAAFSVSLREFYLSTAPTGSLACNSC